jgi:TonB family protein
MQPHHFLALLLIAPLHAASQQPTATPPAPTPPSDPRAFFKAALPHYEFSDPSLKPWHLKATYQLYDLKGKPAEQGTWEYWWASPKVHRSSWERAGVARTEWTISDGSIYRKESGAALHYLERNLETIVLYPMPNQNVIESKRMKLDIKVLGQGPASLTCVTSLLQWQLNGKSQAPPAATPQYHCFDPGTMALLETYTDSILAQYSQIAKLQDHYFARQVSVLIGKLTTLSVTIQSINGIAESDPALNRDDEAIAVRETARHPPETQLANEVSKGTLVKKPLPVYPAVAKAAREQGVVVLGALIGTDGRIRDLEVLASPSKLLTDSALDSVRRWEYRPYQLNGQPVEVETVVNVTYSMSY